VHLYPNPPPFLIKTTPKSPKSAQKRPKTPENAPVGAQQRLLDVGRNSKDGVDLALVVPFFRPILLIFGGGLYEKIDVGGVFWVKKCGKMSEIVRKMSEIGRNNECGRVWQWQIGTVAVAQWQLQIGTVAVAQWQWQWLSGSGSGTVTVCDTGSVTQWQYGTVAVCGSVWQCGSG
jgi:hypothetical protein